MKVCVKVCSKLELLVGAVVVLLTSSAANAQDSRINDTAAVQLSVYSVQQSVQLGKAEFEHRAFNMDIDPIQDVLFLFCGASTWPYQKKICDSCLVSLESA